MQILVHLQLRRPIIYLLLDKLLQSIGLQARLLAQQRMRHLLHASLLRKHVLLLAERSQNVVLLLGSHGGLQ